ncbi:UDP-galactose transporter 5, partial [Striga asiatica]
GGKGKTAPWHLDRAKPQFQIKIAAVCNHDVFQEIGGVIPFSAFGALRLTFSSSCTLMLKHFVPVALFPSIVLRRKCAGGAGGCLHLVMAEPPSQMMQNLKENKVFKLAFAVAGIMATLLIYGVLQEKIMRVPYGPEKEYFKHSLFLVFCNRIATSAVSAGVLLLRLLCFIDIVMLLLLKKHKTVACKLQIVWYMASKKALDPVAPIYKYGAVSVSNILTTTCQYEALKYVSFPVQTLAKCAKMIPVMIWGTFIMQKKYTGRDYLFAFFVTLGCSIFILFPADGDISPYSRGRESTVWGVSLMIGYLGYNEIFCCVLQISMHILKDVALGTWIYLGRLVLGKLPQPTTGTWFDGFTSTFQDKLFKGYDMEIHNQIFYTTLCSCMISFTGLILQGNLQMAIDFVIRHNECFIDIAILSTVATISQFFISYTIRNFGALAFATIMTTRQLVSILLSCLWFSHPLSSEQLIGAVIVFGSIYSKNFLRSKPKTLPSQQIEIGDSSSPRANNA